MGNIEIKSLVQRGTKISITLPAVNISEPIQTNHKKDINKKYSGKVLVMDDDVRDALCNILKKLGFEIYPTAEGGETIREYKKSLKSGSPYDLVVLDLTVPGGMGGKEAIGKLISIDPNINAIICSGYSNDPVMSEYKKFGFKGVIKKPYTIEDLRFTLDSVLL